MPSKTCCVRLVSKVFVECNGRNPCCVGARGTSGWIMFSMRRWCEGGWWCEGGVRQQRNDGGGCATMRERPKSVESPGTYVTK